MVLDVMLDDDAFMPERAYDTDAGFDIRTPVSIELNAFSPTYGCGKATVDTGIHVAIPKGYVGMLKSKSGLNVIHDIMSEGVIDAGYTGSIRVKLYNLGNEEHHFDKGDKITQLVVMPIASIQGVRMIDEMPNSERLSNGFGSTGK